MKSGNTFLYLTVVECSSFSLFLTCCCCDVNTENKEHVKSFEKKEKNMPEMASFATDFQWIVFVSENYKKSGILRPNSGKAGQREKRYFPPVTGNAASCGVGRIHWSYAYGSTRRGLFFVIVIVVAFQSQLVACTELKLLLTFRDRCFPCYQQQSDSSAFSQMST